MHLTNSVLALDIGEKRIGVALARPEISIARPLTTLANDDNFKDELLKIIESNNCDVVVVGLPRGLDSQDTDQTAYVRNFIDSLQLETSVYWQDEAGTSIRAREILDSSGSSYNKEDIDALAACVILEDYIVNLSNERGVSG